MTGILPELWGERLQTAIDIKGEGNSDFSVDSHTFGRYPILELSVLVYMSGV